MQPTQPARRRLLAAMLGCAALAPAVAFGAADSADRFPARPIRIIVPFSAGGVVDTVTRATAERMAQLLRQPVIVENRTGAGGAIGTDVAARATPDGYTLLAVSPSYVIGPLLNSAINWKGARDFRAVAGFGVVPNVIVVPAASRLRSLPELLDAARSQPGALTYASAGVGTSNHLCGELLAQMTEVKLTHVPYKGQPEALTDVLGARVSMMALTAAIARQQVQSGKLRALAVTSAKRSAALPDVPTVAEAARLPGYEVGAWLGLVAPHATPDAVVRKLADAAAQAVSDPVVVKRLADLGMDVAPQSAPAFDRYLDSESQKWTRVLKTAGITAQ
ncbi:tripartite tricarboxylate transporter substrate binding protein [Cupriavidus sp. AcVe19-6a]|uniref:Bug family tripartite tricarboxylate transporter substrate binding protein n=1 Tax=Cupriavidus sp. AcVe19-6a TaxID=2821358 RepID=UPI001AE4D4A0|nr:tripartite tricarboxylate transporter substrate binding protein [Cupriavidus sp. AcVe19-6a]MBP0637815.1 tripartite tricarboxylate transporter substrate binding protein [Cupriavidus sp. AcVe19-6a]